jgi:putative transcriptional regulator
MQERTPSPPSSLAGSLLLAHPALKDSNFRRTVILMTADTKDGAMGVVINRPANRSLSSLGGDFALGPLAEVPLFHGGPVQTKQLILAAWQTKPHGFQLHLGVEPDAAANLLFEPDTQVRAYLGYAGWSPGQLKTELKGNTWLVADAPPDLFTRPGDLGLWRSSLAKEGDEWMLIAGEPDDPAKN